MTSKHILLLILVPLSEIKAIFYSFDKKVSWYLFSDHKRMACNVIEDYSNIVIFGIVFYILAFTKIDNTTKNITAFLFFLNALDFIHLGLYDMQYFIIAKIVLATAIYYLWYKLKPTY